MSKTKEALYEENKIKEAEFFLKDYVFSKIEDDNDFDLVYDQMLERMEDE